jgi:hypothetical protein
MIYSPKFLRILTDLESVTLILLETPFGKDLQDDNYQLVEQLSYNISRLQYMLSRIKYSIYISTFENTDKRVHLLHSILTGISTVKDHESDLRCDGLDIIIKIIKECINNIIRDYKNDIEMVNALNDIIPELIEIIKPIYVQTLPEHEKELLDIAMKHYHIKYDGLFGKIDNIDEFLKDYNNYIKFKSKLREYGD